MGSWSNPAMKLPSQGRNSEFKSRRVHIKFIILILMLATEERDFSEGHINDIVNGLNQTRDGSVDSGDRLIAYIKGS